MAIDIKTRRKIFSMENPYRKTRPLTSKIIFLSLEGCVTEEEYFEVVRNIFGNIRSKIQLVSVAEDAYHTIPKFRTAEQSKMLSKSRSKQLVERIDQFKIEKNDIYQFAEYPEDEFWVVTDVDENWGFWIDEWNDFLKICEEKGYKYALSNPFFEAWLLLHHDVPNDDDKRFAVTDDHPYEKTTHFTDRLRTLGVGLKGKSIDSSHYCEENILNAVEQAKQLHVDKSDFSPKYFCSTVYLVLEKIIEMNQMDV